MRSNTVKKILKVSSNIFKKIVKILRAHQKQILKVSREIIKEFKIKFLENYIHILYSNK